MRAFLIAIVAFTFVSVTPALAAPDVPLGERFVALCKSPTNAGRDACGGVVIALMNAQVEMARQDPNNRFICPPRTLSIEQGRRVFLQWADITPEAANMPFPHLVMIALNKRYPCSQFIVPK